MVTHLPRLQGAGWSPHRDPPPNMALQRTPPSLSFGPLAALARLAAERPLVRRPSGGRRLTIESHDGAWLK